MEVAAGAQAKAVETYRKLVSNRWHHMQERSCFAITYARTLMRYMCMIDGGG